MRVRVNVCYCVWMCLCVCGRVCTSDAAGEGDSVGVCGRGSVNER